MSVDTWTLLGTYLRNLTLNWLVLVPLLATVLLAPRLLVCRSFTGRSRIPWLSAQAMLVMGLLFGLFALTHLHMYRPSLDQLRSKRVWKRFERQQWFLIAGLTPLVAAALLLTTAYAWYRNGGGRLDQLTLFGLDSRGTFVLGGAAMHGIGWLIAAFLLQRWRDVNRWLAVEFLVILWSGALGGLFLWSVLAETPSNIPVSEFAEWYAVFALAGFLTMFLLTATIFIGVASRYTDDHDREWWGRAGAWVLIASISWTGLSALVVFGPGLLSYTPGTVTSLGGLSGVISLLLGFSSKNDGDDQGQAEHHGCDPGSRGSVGRPCVHRLPARPHHTLTSLLMKGMAISTATSGRAQPSG